VLKLNGNVIVTIPFGPGAMGWVVPHLSVRPFGRVNESVLLSNVGNRFLTNSVVASLVEFSDVAGVGAVGLPVKAGESNGALNSTSLFSQFVLLARCRCGSFDMPPGPP